MTRVIFLQDFFVEQHLGGGELHDAVVIDYLTKRGLLFAKQNTYNITPAYILENTDKFWFISNFVALKNVCKALIAKHCKYLIYEHDYKFLKNRNPINYPEFCAPDTSHKYNFTFYRNAKVVVCLSKFHRSIFDTNLGLPNIDNINCSMWNDEDLDLMKSLNRSPKNDKYAIIESTNPIKKTRETVSYCTKAGIPYELIKSDSHHDFLRILSQYKGLVVQTGHPEPTPRIAVEAKMLNCKFVSQKSLIGVAHEDWFHLSGDDLIDEVRVMRDTACRKLEGIVG